MPVAVPFADLNAAGRGLADVLADDIPCRPALVVGIVRGGAPAAFEVARRLCLPLDVLLMRALVMRASGQVLRATSVAGTLRLDEDCHRLSPDSIERLDGVRALIARAAVCRGSRPPAAIAGRTVLLIDNGMRTGKTMLAAIEAVRAMQPARIVAAVPVSAGPALAAVAARADRLHSLAAPASLGNVAMAYRRFDVPGDDRIHDLLDQA